MQKRFHQYLYSHLFALLTILGWYYGQIQQYVSTDDSSCFQLTANFLDQGNKNLADPFVFIKNHEVNDIYTISHPRYRKIRASLSENDTENDDNVEALASSDILSIFRDKFWNLTSDFVTFHDRQIAISLAQSEHLKPLHDDLYIQYRVIRL